MRMSVEICLECISCLLVMLGWSLLMKFIVMRVEVELKVVEILFIIVVNRFVIISFSSFVGSSLNNRVG